MKPEVVEAEAEGFDTQEPHFLFNQSVKEVVLGPRGGPMPPGVMAQRSTLRIPAATSQLVGGRSRFSRRQAVTTR